MNRNRLIYVAALVGATLLARLRPGFVSTVLFYMMLCLPLADLVAVVVTYAGFRITHTIDRRIVAKEDKVTYKLEIVNPTPFLFAPVKIGYTGRELLLHGEEVMQSRLLTLYPNTMEVFEHVIQCRYRGSYNLGAEKVTVSGFFGLFSLTYRGIESLKILVYPRIYELKSVDFRHALSDSAESVVSFDKFDQSIFSELRPYEAGDSLKRIHWKLSAVKNEWIAKEYEGNVNNKTVLMINTEQNHFKSEDNIILEDYLVEGATALSKYLLKNGTPTELHWFNDKAMKIRGTYEKDFTGFYKNLAEMNFRLQTGEGALSLDRMLSQDRDQSVLVVYTIGVTPALADLLLRLQRKGYVVNVVTPLVSNDLNVGPMDLTTGPLYRMMDQGVHVYRLTYENNVCRMEVA